MSWSECWILFESRAEAYEAMHDTSKNNNEVRQATPSDYDNWV